MSGRAATVRPGGYEDLAKAEADGLALAAISSDETDRDFAVSASGLLSPRR